MTGTLCGANSGPPNLHCEPSAGFLRRQTSRRSTLAGVALGLFTVFVWSIYNVGLDIAQADGFRVVDMVFLRFFFGALVLSPLLLLPGMRMPPAGKLLVLCAFVGRLFTIFVASGFHNAPLSHALVITPCISMLVANELVRVLDKEKLTPRRISGMGILVVGLLVVGLDAPAQKGAGGSVIVGDFCFLVSGAMWGSYTYLMSRWKMQPVPMAAGIAIICAIGVAPAYFLFWDLPDIGVRKWAEQIVHQGLMGGALSFVAFAATVSKLGAGRAALFFSLVPPSAVLMAIPMTGVQPTAVQLVSVLLATLGIAISLELRGQAPGSGQNLGDVPFSADGCSSALPR